MDNQNKSKHDIKRPRPTSNILNQPNTKWHNLRLTNTTPQKGTNTNESNPKQEKTTKIDNLYQTKNNFERTKVQWNNQKRTKKTES